MLFSCVIISNIVGIFNKSESENQKVIQSKDVYVEITFNSGTFKGNYVFTPEKGNYLSQINIEFFDGYSNLNASKLVAENGLQIHHFNRTFSGEATKGNHEAKMFTKGCGSLNFIDLQNAKPYKRVNGDFIGCGKTTIASVTDWKTGIVKKRRVITGSFTDTITFEFKMNDGTEKTETAEVTVKFKANESRRN